VRNILDTITADHRAAHAELREGMAALARAGAKGPLQKDGSRMPPKPLSYDSKCFSLAEDFLDDHRPFTEAEAQDLAQYIQNAIEAWFAAREDQ